MILEKMRFVNKGGHELYLYLLKYDDSAVWQWMFEGDHIPMPVSPGIWFNGSNKADMLDWLKGNDWSLHSVVDMFTGKGIG